MKIFLNNLKENLTREEDLPFHLRSATRVPTLVMDSKLKVGRVYALTYKGKDYTIIVIATPNTRTGTYTALNTRNRLLTCINIDLTSSQDQVILQSIYRRERVAEYDTIQDLTTTLDSLLSEHDQNSPSPTPVKFSKFFKRLYDDTKMTTALNLFGKKNFKTFKLKEITNLYFLSMNINEEAFEDY